ncbi:MAG TPA: hypothetical protein VMG41_03240 [Gemmatimonadales bacterium]|nr:hypothetical protein [Gemmatimonadales bacterium]
MPVTAKLSKRFYDTFGDEVTNDLVAWFNQVDATYRQELREQNDLNWARVEARIGQAEASLRSEFNQGLARVETRIGQVEASLRSDFGVGLEQLRSDLLKWMFFFWIGTALTVIGVVAALKG